MRPMPYSERPSDPTSSPSSRRPGASPSAIRPSRRPCPPSRRSPRSPERPKRGPWLPCLYRFWLSHSSLPTALACPQPPRARPPACPRRPHRLTQACPTHSGGTQLGPRLSLDGRHETLVENLISPAIALSVMCATAASMSPLPWRSYPHRPALLPRPSVRFPR